MARGDKERGDKARGDKERGDKARGDKARGDKARGDTETTMQKSEQPETLVNLSALSALVVKNQK
jgi:hypothetical protein